MRAALPEITDEDMQGFLANAREYTVVLLKMGPDYERPDRRPIVREHGRRNFSLRAAGKMVLVGPLEQGIDPVGLCVFATDAAEAARLMDEDPGVIAGIFTYSTHSWTSFPGDTLPA